MLLGPLHELGDKPAVSVGDDALSYGELREAAGALAAQFDGAERVAVWAESTLETIVASVAVIESGAALVPVNPKLGRSELEHVLTDSTPDVIVGAPAELPVEIRRLDGRHRRPRRRAPGARRRRRGPSVGRLHVRHHRRARRARAPAPGGLLQPRRRSPTRGSGPARTCSPTGCRCSTCTGS